jgi:hypothetical protein
MTQTGSGRLLHAPDAEVPAAGQECKVTLQDSAGGSGIVHREFPSWVSPTWQVGLPLRITIRFPVPLSTLRFVRSTEARRFDERAAETGGRRWTVQVS